MQGRRRNRVPGSIQKSIRNADDNDVRPTKLLLAECLRGLFGLFLLAAVLCAIPLPGWSQTAARVTGTVRSSAGKTIAGANVKATGQNRSEPFQATSSDDGTFVFPQLSADTYQISAVATGYSEYGVVVEVGVGQTRTVELNLNTLAESSVIAVANDAATTDLSSARLSVNVTALEVSAMPLNGRGYSILTLFAPGASNRSDGGFDKLSFSGQPNRNNRYSFDGIDASSVIDPNPGWFPVVGTQFRLQTSVETIQEFRVDSALQPAEFGMGAGGQVNLVSRSGGSQLHGSVYEYFRHNDLAARDFFAVSNDSRLRMNQYGFTLGGPIPRLLGKERAFFFGAFEKLGESSRVGGYGSAPTPLLMRIVSPVTRPFLAVLPTAPAHIPGDLISVAERFGMSNLDEWNGSARLDLLPTEEHKVVLRYIKAKQSLDTLDQTTVTPRSMMAYAAPENAMASWNTVFGPVFHELKLGWNRAPTGLSYTTPYSWMRELGLVPGTQLSSWMFGGVGRLAGGEYGRSSDYRSRSYSAMETLSWSAGSHSLKSGFELRAVRVPMSMVGGTVYAFSAEGFIANLGATVTYTGDLHAEARQNLYGAFLQDEWRVRPNLTVNVGMRYEYYSPVSDANGRARVFDMSRLGYLPAGSSFYQAEKWGLAPRIGIAWAPQALKNRTILRVGSAVHYNPGALRDFLGPIQNEVQRLSGANLSYPVNMQTADAAGRAVEDPIGIDSSSHFPERVYQWGFSVQQVLPARFTAQAGYLGSAGRNLLTRRWGNLITSMTPYGQLVRQNPAFSEVRYIAGGGSSNYHALQLQLSRRFTEDLVVGAQYSWSHNLTDTQSDDQTLQNPNCLACEKGPADFDLRHSATVNAYYRVPLGRGSRHLSNGPLGYVLSGFSTGAIFNYRTGLPVNIAIARPDVVFQNAAGAVVPAGTPGARPVLNTPYGGGTRGSSRPDPAAGANPYFDDRLMMFNPAAFLVPRIGAFGSLGRNSLTGPRFSQTDFELTRTFRWGEQRSIDLRADCYNLLNHANFAAPMSSLVNGVPPHQPGTAFGMEQATFFGAISSTIGRNLGLGTARQVQLGLRLSF